MPWPASAPALSPVKAATLLSVLGATIWTGQPCCAASETAALASGCASNPGTANTTSVAHKRTRWLEVACRLSGTAGPCKQNEG